MRGLLRVGGLQGRRGAPREGKTRCARLEAFISMRQRSGERTAVPWLRYPRLPHAVQSRSQCKWRKERRLQQTSRRLERHSLVRYQRQANMVTQQTQRMPWRCRLCNAALGGEGFGGGVVRERQEHCRRRSTLLSSWTSREDQSYRQRAYQMRGTSF